jgi:hypothetical protein
VCELQPRESPHCIYVVSITPFEAPAAVTALDAEVVGPPTPPPHRAAAAAAADG